MTGAPGRKPLLVAATALGFRRGGMIACDDLIVDLRHALVAIEDRDDRRRYPAFDALHDAARAVLQARADRDEWKFTQAQAALQLALGQWWSEAAHGLRVAEGVA